MLLFMLVGCSPRTNTTGNDAGDLNPAGCNSILASCDQPTAGPGGVRLCIEYGSTTATQALSDAQTFCTRTQGNVWDTKPCVTTGQVAGCRLSNALSCSYSWGYTPTTKEIVEQECAPKGGAVVTR